jgi:hypothetical protein
MKEISICDTCSTSPEPCIRPCPDRIKQIEANKDKESGKGEEKCKECEYKKGCNQTTLSRAICQFKKHPQENTYWEKLKIIIDNGNLLSEPELVLIESHNKLIDILKERLK